jgi:hypothetical protein
MITTTTLGKLGRFANQMFTVAGCIGIARKSGQPFAFPKWQNTDHRDRFGSSEDIDIYKHLANPLPELPDGLTFREYGYFWGYRDVHLPTGNWSIDAHMQSDKFFLHCIDEVRHYFTFKNEYEQNEYVAIHYRAGDYQEGDNVHHPRCTREYYDKAIALFPGHKFRVFSDDPDAATRLFDGRYEVVSGDYITSFKMMKACKSFITANSSYSLMAAILGTHPEKQVVCPKKWFGSAWPNPDEMARDIYPVNSIVL